MTHKRPTLIISLLMLIFILPFVAAWLTFSKGLFLSSTTTNKGVLVQPAIAISDLHLQDTDGQAMTSLHGKWWLMYLTDQVNDDTTWRNIFYLRQIRQATGKDRDRINRAIITSKSTELNSQWLQKHYPATVHLTIAPDDMARLEQRLPKKLALRKGSIYLVDPHGNIILVYPATTIPKGILRDLQRVLKVSQIG